MLQPVQERQFTSDSEHNSPVLQAADRACSRCGGAFEPGRKLRATTRHCRACAKDLRNARVSAWKQRKLAEIGREQFRTDYEQCREKRNPRMRLYMQARRARQRLGGCVLARAA